MSDLRPEFEEATIVVLGSFNPEIFHPEWFVRQGLIREKAASKVNVVHTEVSSIEIDNMRFDVNRERFQAATSNAECYEPLRDVVIGCFSIPIHGPVRALGLNRGVHYKAPSEDAWHNVGNKLAPKETWNKHLVKPGMRSLTIEGKRKDESEGIVQIRIEPSGRTKPGIFIALNDHYGLQEEKEEQYCTRLIEILKSNWEELFRFSENVSKSILALM